MVTCVGHTLYNTEDVLAKNGGRPPLSYKSFERAMHALGPPAAPAEDPPARMPPLGPTLNVDGSVPTLAQLGYPATATTDIRVSPSGCRELLCCSSS